MKAIIQDEIDRMQAKVIIFSNGKHTRVILDGEDISMYCQRVSFVHDRKKGSGEAVLETDYNRTIRPSRGEETAPVVTEAETNPDPKIVGAILGAGYQSMVEKCLSQES